MTRIGEHLVDDDASGFLSFPAVSLAADPPGSFGLIHMASLVPRHTAIWKPPIAMTTVWDVWRRILDGAVVVNPDPGPAERAEIDAARGLIFDDPEAGTPSTLYERYRVLMAEYLDAAAAAVEGATAIEETAAAGTEPVEPGAGAPDVAAPTAVLDAARRLAVEGRQADVESALATIARFGLSQPTAMWHDARQAFEVLTNWRTDPASGTEYPETSFVPNSFEGAAWTPIELDAAEIETLSDLAVERFPVLAESHLFDDVIADDGGQLRVSGLRAEITQLVVRQSWFRPDILAMRCWRFRDGDAKAVSDGGRPATGQLPAFVTSIAVIRNLEIDRVRLTVGDHRRSTETVPVTTARSALRREPPAGRVSPRSRPAPFARAVVRDHRSTTPRPRVRDHRGDSPPPSPTDRPVERRPDAPAPIPPHREEAPRITAFVCQLVPHCPDPDPALPDLVQEATS